VLCSPPGGPADAKNAALSDRTDSDSLLVRNTQAERPCSRGNASRVVRLDDPAHILVALVTGEHESTTIADIWKRLMLRIPDVRLAQLPINADIAIFVSAREIGDERALKLYVWNVSVVHPSAVACGTGAKRDEFYLEEPKEGYFMAYASTLETASEVIQQSVNAMEDTELQRIREEKGR
jgi:hypothetical protein